MGDVCVNKVANPGSVTRGREHDPRHDNHPILLNMPLNFFLNFIRTRQKIFCMYILLTISIILAYYLGPSACFLNLTKILTLNSRSESSLKLHNPQKSDQNYIQVYDPKIYENMLKELRLMQQAAIHLQIKQQATDRKTSALQRQFHRMKNSPAAIANEELTRNMIKEALTVYDADKLGLRDYALESFGGSIISTPNTTPKLFRTYNFFFGLLTIQSRSNPRTLIQANVQPGKCFAFYGEQGKIRIQLSNLVFITAITLEHAPVTLLAKEEISSAPKHFEIIGLNHPDEEIGASLGRFVYSINGPSRQTFLITTTVDTIPYQFIEIYILNNHGNIDFTCVYRVRIHGSIV